MRNRKIFLAVLLCALFNFAHGASVISVTIEEECPHAVTISWIGSATQGFNVYRATMLLGTKSFIGSVNYLTKRATDVTAQPGQTYYYYVEAVDQSSSYMSTIAATAYVPAELRTPLSPTASIVTNGIEVSWTYIGSEDGMKIYRSTDFGQYYLVKTITSAFTSSWIDYTVEPGKSYSYKITAYDACGESDASYSSLYVTVPSLPDLVTDSLSITVIGDSLYGRFIVANRGDKTAIERFDVGVLCNDNLVTTWQTDGNLLNGWYLIFNFKYKTSVSRNIVSVCADFNEEVQEYSGLNNCLTDTVYAFPSAATNLPSSSLPRESSIKIDCGFLTVSTEGSFALKVFNVLGREIIQYEGSSVKRFAIKSISAGQYIAVLKTNKKTISRTFNVK